MSLSIALQTALTGLNAANRTAQVVSSNIANALTPGYSRRQLDLTPAVLGGAGAGVGVSGVSRQVSQGLLAERSLAGAALGQESRRFEVLTAIDSIFGSTGTGGLADLYARFEDSLVSAAARPDSATRLDAAVDAAKDLAGALNTAGAEVQEQRAAADRAIAADVDALNAGLQRIHDLNIRMAASREGSDERASLSDLRQAEIDRIAEIVPLRSYARPDGRVALATEGGRMLLDGAPVTVGFTAATSVDAGSAVGDLLSGLTIDGKPVTTPPAGALGGGRLAANFQARDTDLPAAQAQLDALATDLIARLSGSDADLTLGAGPAGLFTDDGGPATVTVGIAQRIEVNALADPAAGGASWRLRDGMQAAAAGPVGDPAGINRLIQVLGEARMPASGDFGPSARTASDLFIAGAAWASGKVASAEYDLTHAQARSDTLEQEVLAKGVDTDAELQTLLSVEQSYAANARVLQVVDDMMRRILEI